MPDGCISQNNLPVKLCVTPSKYMGENVFETIHTAYDLFHNVIINSNLFQPKEETGRSKHQDDLDTEMYIRIFQYHASLSGRKLKTIDENLLPGPGYSGKQNMKGMEVCESAVKIKNDCCDVYDQTSVHNACGLLCSAGRSSFSIDWKGSMFPCNMMDMIKAEPLKEGFKYAWQKINNAANCWPRPIECDNCHYRSVCNNCAAYMLQFAEPGERPVPLCNSTKKMVRLLFRPT